MSVYNDSDEDEKNAENVDLDTSLIDFKQMGYKLRKDQDEGYE